MVMVYKKEYEVPKMTVIEIQHTGMLCVSEFGINGFDEDEDVLDAI